MKLERLIFHLIVNASLFLLVSGCALGTSPQRAETAMLADEELVCEDEASCRDIWTRASLWAKNNTGWRFYNVDFNRITVECYFAKTDNYQIAYQIERVPLDGAKSKVLFKVGRNQATPCVPADAAAVKADFKRFVLRS